MKTPPDRSGITFEVGAQLEARDRHKNWYTATIEKIDYDKEQVLIHYRQWSRRHDEWFQWSSPYLRPLERVSLRRRGLNASASMFVSGSKVMACWTDCRFYPAKILRVNKDDSYTVRFFDGVVRTVKSTKIKPADEKDRCDKGAVGSEGWEEGDSEEEEEQGGPREEEEKKKEAEAEEGEETSGKKEEEEDRKRKAEPSSTQTPVKKKPDESRSSGAPGQPIRADYTVVASSNPAHMDRDVLLERQAHLPTTNKYSREPLYRVIKNQPPPILSIELDHNPFKCLAVGCTKSFRKASLLHYHIKYYHSEQQAEPRAAPRAGPRAEPPPNRRKRLSSEGDDFLLDRTMENSSCNHGDGEQGAMATEVKKEGGRKERRHILRDKLKKRKKKKKKKKSPSGLGSSDDENGVRPPLTLKLNTRPVDPHPPADDGSDWSTLTAESGEDTPSWLVAMETQERCEVVRCVCEVDEENDFMIQCESCQCWQHGTCMGLYEDSVPHNYTCYYCRHTTGWRRAHRFQPEPDWLSSGHMFGLSCVKDNYFDTNSSTVCHTLRLLAHTHSLGHVISGLRLKVSLLHSPSHPDLHLWRLPWRWEEEGLRVMGGGGLRGDMTVSYVSSEHCYQKPGASWEKSEEETEPKTEDVHQEDTPTDTDPKTEDVQQDDTPRDAYRDGKTQPHPQLSTAERKAESEVECQLNLLEHIEDLHQQISDRMDQMDKELDVLESWLDHSGELQPPDPLSRLPQLKQRIRRLLCDLCTVRSLSVCR